MSRFPIIIFGTIGVLLVILLIAFIFGIGRKQTSLPPASLTIVGIENPEIMRDVINNFHEKNQNVNVTYERIDPANYEQTLVNRMAEGQAPDIFFLKNTWVTKHKDKIYPLPQDLLAVSVSDIEHTFADGAFSDLITPSNQILGVPITFNIPVLLYNKDIFNNAGIAKEPKTWDDVVTTSRTLTQKTSAGDVGQSGIALGAYQNVDHAFEIISAMILQEGDPIINPSTNQAVLDIRAKSAVSFYTSFADPQNQNYSWDKRFDNSLDSFSEEKTAMVIAFSTDLTRIKAKNPHLNFGILPFPQKSDSARRIVYADYIFPTVSRTSPNPLSAWQFVLFLASKDSAKRFADGTGLAPARRDLISEKPASSLSQAFYRQALIARTWPVPNEPAVRNLFGNMISSILSKKSSPSEALDRMRDELGLLIPRPQ